MVSLLLWSILGIFAYANLGFASLLMMSRIEGNQRVVRRFHLSIFLAYMFWPLVLAYWAIMRAFGSHA